MGCPIYDNEKDCEIYKIILNCDDCGKDKPLKARKEPGAEVPCSDRVMRDAIELYKPPFQFQHGYIYDDDGNMVADKAGASVIVQVRGWGRIGAMNDAEKLQDAIGEHIAKALTEYWERSA